MHMIRELKADLINKIMVFEFLMNKIHSQVHFYHKRST